MNIHVETWSNKEVSGKNLYFNDLLTVFEWRNTRLEWVPVHIITYTKDGSVRRKKSSEIRFTVDGYSKVIRMDEQDTRRLIIVLKNYISNYYHISEVFVPIKEGIPFRKRLSDIYVKGNIAVYHSSYGYTRTPIIFFPTIDDGMVPAYKIFIDDESFSFILTIPALEVFASQFEANFNLLPQFVLAQEQEEKYEIFLSKMERMYNKEIFNNLQSNNTNPFEYTDDIPRDTDNFDPMKYKKREPEIKDRPHYITEIKKEPKNNEPEEPHKDNTIVEEAITILHEEVNNAPHEENKEDNSDTNMDVHEEYLYQKSDDELLSIIKSLLGDEDDLLLIDHLLNMVRDMKVKTVDELKKALYYEEPEEDPVKIYGDQPSEILKDLKNSMNGDDNMIVLTSDPVYKNYKDDPHTKKIVEEAPIPKEKIDLKEVKKTEEIKEDNDYPLGLEGVDLINEEPSNNGKKDIEDMKPVEDRDPIGNIGKYDVKQLAEVFKSQFDKDWVEKQIERYLKYFEDRPPLGLNLLLKILDYPAEVNIYKRYKGYMKEFPKLDEQVEDLKTLLKKLKTLLKSNKIYKKKDFDWTFADLYRRGTYGRLDYTDVDYALPLLDILQGKAMFADRGVFGVLDPRIVVLLYAAKQVPFYVNTGKVLNKMFLTDRMKMDYSLRLDLVNGFDTFFDVWESVETSYDWKDKTPRINLLRLEYPFVLERKIPVTYVGGSTKYAKSRYMLESLIDVILNQAYYDYKKGTKFQNMDKYMWWVAKFSYMGDFTLLDREFVFYDLYSRWYKELREEPKFMNIFIRILGRLAFPYSVDKQVPVHELYEPFEVHPFEDEVDDYPLRFALKLSQTKLISRQSLFKQYPEIFGGRLGLLVDLYIRYTMSEIKDEVTLLEEMKDMFNIADEILEKIRKVIRRHL